MGNGYVRQSSAEIVDDEIIEAADLNAEFDALEDFASGTTGHTHDGTTGEGPKIDLTTSITGVLPIANGGSGGINKTDATVDPTSLDDDSEGYSVGSLWVNNSTDKVFICVDASTSAAIWQTYQLLDTELTALAGLTSAADKGIQFTGAGTAATYTLTSFAKTILDDPDAATVRATIGSNSATNLTTGTVPDGRLTGTYTGFNLNTSGTVTAATSVTSGLFVSTPTSGGLRTNTSSGSDNKSVSLAGGGDFTLTRGGYVKAYGNNAAGFPGHVDVVAGSTGAIRLIGDSTLDGDVTVTGTLDVTGAIAGTISNATTATNWSRSVVAGNGLTGGGAGTSNITLTLGTPTAVTTTSTNSVTSTGHTHALTLTSGNLISILGYTPASNALTLTAGTGLTGGGNLTTNRSFAVSYGTTAGTAAQGNDTRITGAMQTSGGTFTGSVILAGAPTTDLQAATKKYVDDADAGIGIGVGQTWQDVKASRAVNTTYQNTTGKPIQVSFGYEFGQTDGRFWVSADGSTWIAAGYVDNGAVPSCCLIIPNNWRYRIGASTAATDPISEGGNLWLWSELR